MRRRPHQPPFSSHSSKPKTDVSFIRRAASYCEVLESLNGVLAHIDVLQRFVPVLASSHAPTDPSPPRSLAASALAAPIPYIKPTVFERGAGSLRLEEARHPCLEVQEGINFIANDVHLERGTYASPPYDHRGELTDPLSQT